MKTLPDKPSELIKLALEDLEKVEKKWFTYKVNMGVWHAPVRFRCHVCLAGSVIAMSLEAPRERTEPNAFPRDVEKKLNALNFFRMGDVEFAVNLLVGIQDVPEAIKMRPHMLVHPYSTSPRDFKADLRAIARHLEKHGL